MHDVFLNPIVLQSVCQPSKLSAFCCETFRQILQRTHWTSVTNLVNPWAVTAVAQKVHLPDATEVSRLQPLHSTHVSLGVLDEE